jgi:hypothetical protein
MKGQVPVNDLTRVAVALYNGSHALSDYLSLRFRGAASQVCTVDNSLLRR